MAEGILLEVPADGVLDWLAVINLVDQDSNFADEDAKKQEMLTLRQSPYPTVTSNFVYVLSTDLLERLLACSRCTTM